MPDREWGEASSMGHESFDNNGGQFTDDVFLRLTEDAATARGQIHGVNVRASRALQNLVGSLNLNQ